MLTVVYAGLALIALTCAVTLAWRRLRRLERRIAAHERALLLADQSPDQPPPDGGRHLRLVAAWLPLAVAGSWLASRVRAHPKVVSAVALTAAAGTLAGIVILAPTSPPDDVGLPPTISHPHRRRPPLLTDHTQPGTAGVSSRTATGVQPPPTGAPPPGSGGTLLLPPPPSKTTTTSAAPPPPSMTITTTTTDTPGPPPTTTGTRPPPLCLDINLPPLRIVLGLGDCVPSGLLGVD